MKEIEIIYKGQPTKIEIDDHPKAGVITKIVKMCQRRIQGSPIPDIDYDEYFIGLATNLVKKAPWKLESPTELKDMDWEDYANLQIALGEEFPLERVLPPLGKLMFGKKFEIKDSISQTESITNVQNSDSPSAK